MTLRIIATSDNHLGRYYARMPTRILEERRQRIREAFDKAVNYAIDHRAHLMLLAGDLFDNVNPRNPERVFLSNCLRRLVEAGIKVAAIGGNHDAPRSRTEEGGHPPLAVYSELGVMNFFGQLGEDRIIRPQVFAFDSLRVAVGGFTPDTNLPATEDPLEGVTFAKAEADLRVLLVHAGIEGMMYPGSEAVIKRATLESLEDVDLLVAGNVHRYDSFRIGCTEVVVPGASEWMDFGEARSFTPGFVRIDVNSRNGLVVHHIPIAAQPRIEIRLDAAELEDEDPTLTVMTMLRARANKDAIVRLSIEGHLDRRVFMKLNHSALEDCARDCFFYCDVDLTGLYVQLEEGEARAPAIRRTVREEIDQVIDSFLSQTDSPEERSGLELTRQALLGRLQEIEQ